MTYEGMPHDWYMRLTGAAGRMLRGEIPLTSTIPIDPNKDLNQLIRQAVGEVFSGEVVLAAHEFRWLRPVTNRPPAHRGNRSG